MIPRDWNRERYRTRDRLLEYDHSIYPSVPHSAGLSMIYPWEDINLAVLTKQLFQIAAGSGFSGSEEDFYTKFGSFLQGRQIIFGTLATFEVSDDSNCLYYDTEENILYYYDSNAEEYTPINALLIDGTILDAGHAPEE